MDQPKYLINIFWSEEDGGYIANVPDLRYCSAFGETYEEALHEVLVAMKLHLDTLREMDRVIPERNIDELMVAGPVPDLAEIISEIDPAVLTDRQREILELLNRGHDIGDIAKQLRQSPTDVRAEVKAAYYALKNAEAVDIDTLDYLRERAAL